MGSVWSQWRLVPGRLGGIPGVFLLLGFIGALGYMLPSSMGLGFLDPHLIVMYACSSPFFLSSVVAAAFFDPGELLGKVVACVLYGWLSSLLLLGMALTTVNVESWHGTAVLPETGFLAWALLLGLNLSLFTTGLGAALSLGNRDSQSVKRLLRSGFFWLLVAVVILARYGLLEWRESMTGLLTAEGMARLSGMASVVLAAVSALLLRKVARHPRYSEASSK